jgi:hypothetical protein
MSGPRARKFRKRNLSGGVAPEQVPVFWDHAYKVNPDPEGNRKQRRAWARKQRNLNKNRKGTEADQ